MSEHTHEPFDVPDGYAPKRKTIPAPRIRVRRMTLDEVKALSGHAEFIANDGKLRTLKINGAVRTWKRDATRVEVPVKYGMREYATFDTAEALRRFVVRVTVHEQLTVPDRDEEPCTDCDCGVCTGLRADGKEPLHVIRLCRKCGAKMTEHDTEVCEDIGTR